MRVIVADSGLGQQRIERIPRGAGGRVPKRLPAMQPPPHLPRASDIDGATARPSAHRQRPMHQPWPPPGSRRGLPFIDNPEVREARHSSSNGRVAKMGFGGHWRGIDPLARSGARPERRTLSMLPTEFSSGAFMSCSTVPQGANRRQHPHPRPLVTVRPHRGADPPAGSNSRGRAEIVGECLVMLRYSVGIGAARSPDAHQGAPGQQRSRMTGQAVDWRDGPGSSRTVGPKPLGDDGDG